MVTCHAHASHVQITTVFVTDVDPREECWPVRTRKNEKLTLFLFCLALALTLTLALTLALNLAPAFVGLAPRSVAAPVVTVIVAFTATITIAGGSSVAAGTVTTIAKSMAYACCQAWGHTLEFSASSIWFAL